MDDVDIFSIMNLRLSVNHIYTLFYVNVNQLTLTQRGQLRRYVCSWICFALDEELWDVCVWVCGAQFQSNWFLTSCLLALVSAVPEHHQPLGGSQTLRRRERGDTHSHTPQEKAGLTPTDTLCLHAHIQTFTQSLKKPDRGVGGGLTDVCSVWDDQPFLPAVETYTHKHTQRRLVVPVVMCLNVCLNNCLLTFPFAWILLRLFKQAWKVDHYTVA